MILIERGMGLSRLMTHLNDDIDFCVIGSQDKDTRADRSSELKQLINSLLSKHKVKSYKQLKGSYTYDNGDIGEETSFMLMGISKQDALNLADKLNQESIVWKDNEFFGFLKPDGTEDGTLQRELTFKDVDAFGSRMAHKDTHNKGKKFAFKMESISPRYTSGVRNMAQQKPRVELIESWEF